MDELIVVSVCAYLTRTEVPWRAEDYDASKFIKAIKGKILNGYATVPVGKFRHHLENRNAASAIEWAADLLLGPILDEYQDDEIVFVPIPGSSCISPADVRSCRTFRLAEACRARVVPQIAATVEPWLWWSEPLQATHQGGVRDAAFLLAHAVVDPGCVFSRVVLIDDVITSGAHFTAAAAGLERAGADVADAGYCVGRVVHELEDQPFSVGIRRVPDRP